MHYICTITDQRVKVDGNLFSSIVLNQPHPIFRLSLKQLCKLAQQKIQNQNEQELLFLAMALQLPSVNLSGKIPLPLPSHYPRFAQLYQSKLLELLDWSDTYKLGKLPEFNLSKDTLLAFPNYLKMLADIKLCGDYRPKNYEPLDMESRLARRQELAKASAIRKAQDKLSLANVIDWASDVLQYSAIQRKLFHKAASKQGNGIDNLQDFVNDCLDRLPESNELQYIKKVWLLDQLQAQLYDRIKILQALGVDISHRTEYLEVMAESYSIQDREGKRHLNASSATAKIIVDHQRAEQLTRQEAPALVEVSKDRPEPEQFQSRMAFLVALNTWKAAQGQ